MRILSRCAAIVLACGIVLSVGAAAHSQIIADLRGDFRPGDKLGSTTQSGTHEDGLPDQGRTGYWNYYTTAAAHPKEWQLEPLTWDRTWRSEAEDAPSGYVAAKSRMHIGSVTGGKPAIHGEKAPAEGYCAMHPSLAPGAVIAEWTSRTSGDVKIAGAIEMALDAKQSGVTFMVVKKDAGGTFTPLVEAMTIVDVKNHPYQATTSIAPNDRVYFVLGANGSPWSDHSHVSARIARVAAEKSADEKPKAEVNAEPKKENCEECDSTRRLFRWRRGR